MRHQCVDVSHPAARDGVHPLQCPQLGSKCSGSRFHTLSAPDQSIWVAAFHSEDSQLATSSTDIDRPLRTCRQRIAHCSRMAAAHMSSSPTCTGIGHAAHTRRRSDAHRCVACASFWRYSSSCCTMRPVVCLGSWGQDTSYRHQQAAARFDGCAPFARPHKFESMTPIAPKV